MDLLCANDASKGPGASVTHQNF